jgi:hypothetical protein
MNFQPLPDSVTAGRSTAWVTAAAPPEVAISAPMPSRTLNVIEDHLTFIEKFGTEHLTLAAARIERGRALRFTDGRKLLANIDPQLLREACNAGHSIAAGVDCTNWPIRQSPIWQ